MVYKKRYRRRRPLNKAQYRQVAKIANKQIHKASELKTKDSNDTAINTTTPSASDTFVKVSFPVQGLSNDERIGDSIYLRKVNLRAFVENELDEDLAMRVIVCQTYDNNPSALEYQEILETPGSAGSSINSFYITDPARKFKILHDAVHHWDSNPNSKGRRQLNLTFKGKQLGIHKPDFDQAASGNCTGQIWYTAFSNTADKGGLTAIQTRVRYYDN